MRNVWDGKSCDEIRILRDSIRADKQNLKNAPLGPIQQLQLRRQIKRQKARLKELNRQKRERKKAQIKEVLP